jgi:hypothetical protein
VPRLPPVAGTESFGFHTGPAALETIPFESASDCRMAPDRSGFAWRAAGRGCGASRAPEGRRPLKRPIRLLPLMAGALLSITGPVHAQQRPLVTEDPEIIGTGRVLLEGGLEVRWDQTFSASGLEGNLWRVPVVGVSVGIGPIAELQIDGGLGRLSIERRVAAPLSGLLDLEADASSTSSFEDLVVATKIRVLSETPTRPALGVRLATKLPNASNQSGLGLDTTDFFVSALAGKTVVSIRVVGNVGLGILGDPLSATDQNDVLTYGVSFARALTDQAEVVAEVNGHFDTRAGEPPPGTESRSLVRVGARYTIGAGRVDAGFLMGLTAHEPQFGITAGYTYVFDAFTAP